MQGKSERFAVIALQHLDAAYNLARWLTRNDADAADVVQESCLRALTYVDSYRGENGRAWLLTIVRNTCYRWLERNRPSAITPLSPEVEAEATAAAAGTAGDASSPESIVARQCDAALLNGLIAELPLLFREVLVLREIEELSYRDIGAVLGVPIGTVMSRLARARGALKEAWLRRTMRGPSDGL
ncbi:MAG TPA: sigma-70 family RNA polymerase sigma factor [Stellaceae bacterium]